MILCIMLNLRNRFPLLVSNLVILHPCFPWFYGKQHAALSNLILQKRVKVYVSKLVINTEEHERQIIWHNQHGIRLDVETEKTDNESGSYWFFLGGGVFMSKTSASWRYKLWQRSISGRSYNSKERLRFWSHLGREWPFLGISGWCLRCAQPSVLQRFHCTGLGSFA